MKKILMIGLIATLCANVSAQSTYQQVKKDATTLVDSAGSVVSTVANGTVSVVQKSVTAIKDGAEYVDTSTVTNKLYSDVKGIVMSVAKGLGVAAERVYTVLTRHYLVQGVVQLLLIIGIIWFAIWGIKKLIISCKGSEVSGLPYVLAIGVFLAAAISLFNFLPTTIGMIFNAEYYTINHIIDLIK